MKTGLFFTTTLLALGQLQPLPSAIASATLQPFAPEFVTGYAMVKTPALEETLKQVLTHVFQGTLQNNEIKLTLPEIQQTIEIPARGDFRELLSILGIRNQMDLRVDPIDVSVNIPKNSLKLNVKKTNERKFLVEARTQIRDFRIGSAKVSIAVPKGLFDQPFLIDSTPVVLDLQENKHPILLGIDFEVDLEPVGMKVRLVKLKTNLNSQLGPQFGAALGRLTVQGRPLFLSIISNGQILTATESSLRKQFKNIEPDLSKTLVVKLEEVLQSTVQDSNDKLAKLPPIRFDFNSSDWIPKGQEDKPETALYRDLVGTLQLSHLQYSSKNQFFTAQVASRLCSETQCVFNTTKDTPLSGQDLKPAETFDGGLLIAESWIQNVIHNSDLQGRFQRYFKSQSTPGVQLGAQGIRVHFDEKENSIDVVANMVIDIKNAGRTDTPKRDRMFLKLGDLIEKYFGSGEKVLLPIDLKFQITTENEKDGTRILTLKTIYPFLPNQKLRNTYRYPSNIDKMAGIVRKYFMETLETEIKGMIPTHFRIPLVDVLKNYGSSLNVQTIQVTPNRGLLITYNMGKEKKR